MGALARVVGQASEYRCRIGVNPVPGKCDGVAIQVKLADLNGRDVEDDGSLGLTGTRHHCEFSSRLVGPDRVSNQ
jgi:hypothetical protein